MSDTTTPLLRPWPYPRYIAHRGAGKLAPENTLAAFRLGAQFGWRMFECDVKLSADDIPFLLHDSTLERTTNGTGMAGEHSWAELAQLDAGRWLSRIWAGEPMPSLENIARFCLANHLHINLEIKPTPGQEMRTGRVVAQHATRLWEGAGSLPLLSSFRPEALTAAREAAPELPRALLLDTLWEGCLEQAQALACTALVCHHTLWDAALVERVHALGLRAVSYTVNDPTAATALLALGTDALITDRIDLFSPAQP